MAYRDLALEIVRATELGAIASSFYVGRGDKEAGDKAAVDAIRFYMSSVVIDGTIIIGEGEKDEAPMLYNGEKVGSGKGPKVDVAVDPVEGTTVLAKGQANAISTIAIADEGAMLRPGSSFYMDKLVVPRAAKNVIDIDASPTTNCRRIAAALDKDINALTVCVLDRPRNAALIRELRQIGVRIILIFHGDVAGGVSAALSTTDIDVLYGIGGTPEAIITAAAVKSLDGGMQCRRAPQLESERDRLKDEGTDIQEVLELSDLIRSGNTFFAATGITSSSFLRGVQFKSHHIVTTHSIVMRSQSGTIRYVEGIHDLRKKLTVVSDLPFSLTPPSAP